HERVQVLEVNRRKLEAAARSEAPQGVIAFAAPLPEYELADFLKRRAGKAPFLVAVDGVTDPGNLGALLRCCDGAGVTGVVLPRHRAVHITPTAAKSAAG
ncbi:MAG TPA: TrmH family RNA methyltransferase, partial [Ilumatobacteraceae bacterium]|nr:TrmH family RNA methyltransferase [Ilumatobacteraceae bacterium]